MGDNNYVDYETLQMRAKIYEAELVRKDKIIQDLKAEVEEVRNENDELKNANPAVLQNRPQSVLSGVSQYNFESPLPEYKCEMETDETKELTFKQLKRCVLVQKFILQKEKLLEIKPSQK